MRYFFNLEGDGSGPDEDGVLFPDDGAARQAAVLALGEAVRDKGGLFWARREWTLSVTDEQEREVCRLTVQGWAAS